MRRTRVVAILDYLREPHTEHFGVKANRRFEVRADERQMIDAAGIECFGRGVGASQVAFR
jgi:hypothetical protein